MIERPNGRSGMNSNGETTGSLTLAAVLATALECIDRDGVDALSMRRLGKELGRDPMVLYRLVPSKAALLDGVAELVLGSLVVDTADPDWIHQLRMVARRFRELALAHPKVVPLLVTRPLATPLGLRPLGTLRPLEDVLRLHRAPRCRHIRRHIFPYLRFRHAT